MKNKGFFKGLVLIFVLVIAFLIGASAKQNKEIVKVDNVLYASTDSFYLEDGWIGVEFSDGSWAVVNEAEGMYIFQPVELDSWSYEFNNLDDFKDCIVTYLNMKNNGSY